MEDGEIIDLYFERNEEAIRATSDKYGARLRALSFGITADEMTAEECENDTYLEAWKLIPPNEPKTYFYAFLARIVRHISLDRCREQKRLKRSGITVELNEELSGSLPCTCGVEDEENARILGELIGKYLLALPYEKRVIFMRRYFCFDQISDIGKRFSLSESKVKTTLMRVRRGLGEYLKKEGYFL